jgi:hypothetical protein
MKDQNRAGPASTKANIQINMVSGSRVSVDVFLSGYFNDCTIIPHFVANKNPPARLDRGYFDDDTN